MKWIWACLWLVLAVGVKPALSQSRNEIDSLERVLDLRYGVEKISVLNQLSIYFRDIDKKKALKYGRQAATLSQTHFTKGNLMASDAHQLQNFTAHYQLGLLYYDNEKFDLARGEAEQAYNIATYINDSTSTVRSEALMELISGKDSGTGVFKRKLKSLGLKKKINTTTGRLKISTIILLAQEWERLKKYDKAIKEYKWAINLYQNLGNTKKVAALQAKVAELHKLQGDQAEAIAFYQMASDKFVKLEDTTAIANSKEALAELYESPRLSPTPYSDKHLSSPTLATDMPNVAPIVIIDQSEEEIKATIKDYQALYKSFENKQDYDQSLKYLRLYTTLERQLLEKQQQKAIDSVDLLAKAQQITMLEQKNAINDLAMIRQLEQLERQRQLRNGLIAGAVVLLGLAGIFFWMFRTKRKAHADLTITHRHLQTTQDNLSKAEQRIKKLLGQQVSDEIAQALIKENAVEGNISKFVCVMFLDIRDFTGFASKRTPEEVIAYQNDVFGFMIEIVAKHHGIINQFMGDGFMATFGIPASKGNDTANAFAAAVGILEEVECRSQNGRIPPTRIGIGLHAGHVVAGNVGTDLRKQYSITGTTVITAARIEQLNKKYASQLLISESVKEQLGTKAPTDVESMEASLKGLAQPVKVYKVA